MGAGQENLWPAVFAADIQDQGADAVPDPCRFARDLLVAADNALGTAQIDDHMAEFDRLDDTGDDLARAVLEFFKLPLALGVANLLENHLLGRLCIDASEIDFRQRVDDEVANLGTWLEFLGLLDIDLLEIVLDLVNHFDNPPQTQVTRFDIEFCANVILCAIAGAGSLLDCLLKRLDHDRLVDHLFRRNGGRNSEQFRFIG